MSLSSALIPILSGGGSATVFSSAVGTFVIKTLKRVATDAVRDGTQDIRNDVSALQLKLAAETGGNSNGLRQAVNALDAKVDGVVTDVAYLKGKAGA